MYVHVSAMNALSCFTNVVVLFADIDPEANGRQRHSKITATVGLVVHAAGMEISLCYPLSHTIMIYQK